MSTSGLVKRDIVLRILTAHGVLILPQDDGNIVLVSPNCPDDPESIWLGEEVPRQIVHRLSRKHGIAIARFYNPDASPETPQSQQACE